jgi:prepilin-type N-terminal cleavage/methylation domain-containing protein
MISAKKRNTRQGGFTLIEAMISIVVMAIGILGLAAVYAQGIMYANSAQYQYIAEKKAEEAVETIFTARDTGLAQWAQIQNNTVTGPPPGLFLTGPQPLCDPGADGLVGTADDNCNLPDTIITGPGPDGILGTADDTKIVLNNLMTRQIQITNVTNEPNLREITVTIQYNAAGRARTYTLVCYISAFS